MSLLSEYASLEQTMKNLQERMKQLENNESMATELKFKEELEKVLKKFDKTPREAMTVLNPAPVKNGSVPTTRKARKLKIYKNPETGEVVETRGGNNKTLKAWKDQFGAETVENEFLVRTEG